MSIGANDAEVLSEQDLHVEGYGVCLVKRMLGIQVFEGNTLFVRLILEIGGGNNVANLEHEDGIVSPSATMPRCLDFIGCVFQAIQIFGSPLRIYALGVSDILLRQGVS